MSDQSVAIVTGGASGIGLGIASTLIAEGYDVFVLDNDLQHVDEYNASHPLSRARVCDVSDASAVVTEIDGVFYVAGRIDLLVNNAGIYDRRSIEATTEEQFDKMLAVNTKGPFLGIKLALEALKASGNASIVNLSSTAGLRGSFAVHYGASKGALRLMTKSIASTYAKDGIRCNSVHPGPIDTEMGHTAVPPDQLEERLYQRIPMGRFGTAEEVANVILFLASDESSFVTGSEVVVDGGATCK